MMVALLIAGSRTVEPGLDLIDAEVLKLPIWGDIDPTVARIRDVVQFVIGGESPGGGADDAAEPWARRHGIEYIPMPILDEDSTPYGDRVAPKMRNRRMAAVGTHALIFWDGLSGGSADMCTRMVARGKHVTVVPLKPTRKTTKSRRARSPSGS